MYDDLSNTKPIKEYYGHENNIFCAIFDSSVRHVMSCGLDGIIFRYDIETGGSPLSEYQHDDSVFKIDLLCSSDEVLFSAGNDCRLRLWDFRASGVCPSQERKENFSISSLACHPTVDHLLLIGGLDGQLSLFDIRNGLGHKSVRDFDIDSDCMEPTISHIEFSKDGSLFTPSIMGGNPCIYSLALCIEEDVFFDPRYSSIITMKNNSFGFNDNSILCGSDRGIIFDFDLKGKTKVLRKCQSNVNSVIVHPILPLIVAAGVEKSVKFISSVDLGERAITTDSDILEDPEVIEMFQILNDSHFQYDSEFIDTI